MSEVEKEADIVVDTKQLITTKNPRGIPAVVFIVSFCSLDTTTAVCGAQAQMSVRRIAMRSEVPSALSLPLAAAPCVHAAIAPLGYL